MVLITIVAFYLNAAPAFAISQPGSPDLRAGGQGAAATLFCAVATVDLLPCGHHYLTSRDALAASGATVIDETGTIMDPAPAGIEAGIPAPAGIRR